MHEMSIATALVKQVLDLAKENALVRIERVELEVGALQLVVPEALDMAFKAASHDTPASGAVLHQEVIPVRARCRACGQDYVPDMDTSYQCDRCGVAEPEILAGRDIILRSLSGPGEDEGGSGEDQGG